MDMGYEAILAFAAMVVIAVATWMVCRWWYGRKLLAAARRLHKSDQSRVFSHQQTMQARKQIEVLKKELATHTQASSQTQASRQRASELERTLFSAEMARDPPAKAPQAPDHGFADTQVVGLMSFQPSHGFADTQVMP